MGILGGTAVASFMVKALEAKRLTYYKRQHASLRTFQVSTFISKHEWAKGIDIYLLGDPKNETVSYKQ